MRCLTQTHVAPANQKNQRPAPLLQPYHTCHTPKVTISRQLPCSLLLLSAGRSLEHVFLFLFHEKGGASHCLLTLGLD